MIRWKIAQFCERMWWRMYLSKRDKNDYLTWKRDYWHRFLEEIKASAKPNSTIADLGCGPAGLFTIFETQNVEAVDPLLSVYQADLQHFKQTDYPSVGFVESTIEDWQPRNNPYHYIYCINAINHVADIDAALSKIKSATSKQTTLVISTDAHRRPWLKEIFRLFPGDILHPHQFTKQGYQDLFTKAGLPKNAEIYLNKREFIFDYLVFVWRPGSL